MLVSVCMITYNHESYIARAIEGVLMQLTDFNFNLIISDDYSTDNTNEVIKQIIASAHKHEIKYTRQEKNLGLQSNFIYALSQCEGKYIAICEGDDYWTDPYKLRKQVDYISKNQYCNLVFTDVKLFVQDENKYKGNWANITKERYAFKDIAAGNMITTCTVLFRKPAGLDLVAKWLHHFTIGDYPLWLLLLRNGYAFFLKETTAVYRQHSTGVFSLKGPGYLIDATIKILTTAQHLSLTKREFYLVRKNIIKWYYAKAVRMSNDLEFKQVRQLIKQQVKLSDIYYNPSCFFRLMLLYVFPKMKSGVFETKDTKEEAALITESY